MHILYANYEVVYTRIQSMEKKRKGKRKEREKELG
jgi:hypothetical protein